MASASPGSPLTAADADHRADGSVPRRSAPPPASETILPSAAPFWPFGVLALLALGVAWALTDVRSPVARPELLVDTNRVFPVAVPAVLAAALGLTLLLDLRRIFSWAVGTTEEDASVDWVSPFKQWCQRLLHERHQPTELQEEVGRWCSRLAGQLGQRWLKYYLTALALPLLGFVLAVSAGPTRPGTVEDLSLLRPLVVATTATGVLLAGALLGARAGTQTLEDYRIELKKLANSEVGTQTPSKERTTAVPEKAQPTATPHSPETKPPAQAQPVQPPLPSTPVDPDPPWKRKKAHDEDEDEDDPRKRYSSPDF